MLGYRTFLTIAGDRRDVPRLIDEQIYSWLSEKGWQNDDLGSGDEVELEPGVTGRLTRLDGADGSVATRLLTLQSSGWTTQITAQVPAQPARDAWLWIDVDAPFGQRPGAPRLMRKLLDVLDLRDGSYQIPPQAVRVREDGVDDLVARLVDPDRRTLTFVAGSGSGVPFDGWAKHVEKIVRGTSGLASTHVLTPGATTLLTQRLAGFGVRPFTVRTFLPGVDVSNPDDALRHRFLTMQRIVDADHTGQLSAILRSRALATSRELELPKAAFRVDQMFSRKVDAELIEKLAEPIAPVVPLDDTSTLTDAVSVEPVPPEVLTDSQSEEFEVLTPLRGLALRTLGVDRLDREAVRQLAELVLLGQQARSTRSAIEARLTALQDQLDATGSELRLTRSQLNDQALDLAVADMDRLRAEDLARRLRSRLVDAGDGAHAYLDQPLVDNELVPEDIQGLFERLPSLTRVRFTGDQGVAIALDEHPVVGWALKSWEALTALEDYAACKADGRWAGDVHGYLTDLPVGCHGYSVNRFGRDESSDVKQNPKFSRPRFLPVPTCVDPSGEVFMGAHFKIANWQLVSPRLHFYDDTAGSGLIYVGYLGPHLPTQKTN